MSEHSFRMRRRGNSINVVMVVNIQDFQQKLRGIITFPTKRNLLTLALLLCVISGCSIRRSTTPVATQQATLNAYPLPTLVFPETGAVSPSAPPPTAVATVSEMENTFNLKREAMVKDQIEARGITDPLVLMAIRSVPRHQFVPNEFLDQAYADHPLPIGYGQTISQPYIVALMSAALQVKSGDHVLEIGTGSGYQAAVLEAMGMQVYTIEIIPELAELAITRLSDLGYTKIQTLRSDGYFGWPEFAPYDAIIVTAAPDHLPQPLGEQLKEGGRLIIPIGPVGAVQTLWLFEKVNGELQATNLGGVRFVPLTGGPSRP